MALYGYQEKLIREWLNIGKTGVIKSPRGLGKYNNRLNNNRLIESKK